MNHLRTDFRTGFALLACCTGGLLVSNAWGQRDGESRRGFDPAEILKRIDANGNGTIEPSELSERSRGFVGDLAKRANLDASQPIPVDKLIGAAEQQRKERESGGSSSGSTSGSSSGSQPGSSSNSSNNSNDRDRDRDRDRSDSDRDRDREREREREREKAATAKPMTPVVLGFGSEDKTPKASGFDVPLSVDTTIPLEKRYDSRVLEYVDRMLRDQDKNKDGYIDNVEWKEGRWSTPPEESDTNKDNRLSKMELCERIARRFGLTNPPGATSSTAPASGSPATGSTSAATSGDAAKFRQYAESLLRQFDRNKNGVLEKDEWSEMKSEHRSADANADSVITIDELAAKLQAYSTSTASSSPGSGTSARKDWWSKSSKTTAKPGEKKDYRFQTSAERLPKGLPDWFLRSDADADGQIAMVEYATTWTDSTAAEFQKYDLDGDGFITPDECLASVAPKK